MGAHEDKTSGDRCPWTLSLGDTTMCGCETIVKFTSDAAASTLPKLSAACTGDQLSVIAIDNLLATVQEQDVCCTNFKSKVDDVAVLAGGYVALGEESGVLTIGVLEEGSKFRVKQSCNVLQDMKNIKDFAFLRVLFQVIDGGKVKDGSMARIVCLLSGGLLVVFNNIVLNDGDIDLSRVRMEKTLTPHEEASDVAVFQDHILTVGSGADCLAVYTVENGQIVLEDTVSLDDSVHMVKVRSLAHADIFVTLNSKGQFYLWDMLTLTVVYSWCLPNITDFNLVEMKTESPFSLDEMKLVTVQENMVRTLALPSLSVISECGTGSGHIKLSKCLTIQDEIFVAECCTFEDGIESETTVFLRCYAETSPQKRLLRLIAKRRFDEAEQLAKLHGLSYNLDPVIVQSKMREAKDTFAETHKHLQHCKELLKKNTSGEKSVQQVLSELQEVEHRLESFKLVYGEENYNPMNWEIFQHESPLAMCSQLLMIDAEKAFTLWRCFQTELEKQLKPGLIQQVLQRIPSQVPCKTVVDWLCDAIIPSIVLADPGALIDMIEWIEDEVSIMESHNQEAWTDSAIHVCQILLKNLELAVQCDVEDITDNDLQTVKIKMDCELALAPLKMLVQHLLGLKELKTKYNCHLPLDVYRKENQASIVFRMLDKVAAVDLLQSTLTDQVLPYIRHHNLVADEIFAKYIKDLLEKTVACHAQYSWEEKVKAVIKVIGDPKEKVVAVLNLLANVMLPLPDFVESLVTEVLSTVQHSLVATLSEKWRIKEADNIVYLHGMKPCEVRTTFQAKAVAKFIVASGGTVADAEKVLSASNISAKDDDELCRFMCRLFVERNQIEQLSDYLKTLPKKLAVSCCQFILSTAGYMMAEKNSPMIQEMKQVRLQYFESAMKTASILKSLTDDIFERDEIDKQAQTIKQAWDLEVHHNIHVNETILNNKEECMEILSKCGNKQHPALTIRLAKQLNLRSCDVLAVVMTRLEEESHRHPVVCLLQEMARICNHRELSPAHLYELLSLVYKQDAPSLPELCLKLAQLMLTYSSEETIKTAVSMCQLASLMKDIHSQCQDCVNARDEEPWDVPVFKESSPSLDSELVLPDIQASLQELTAHGPYGGGWSQLESAVQYLCTEGQHQLALRTLLQSASLIHPTAVFLSSDKQQTYQTLLEKILALSSRITSSLIMKILNSGQLDAQLALAHVLVLPMKQGVSMLQGAIKSCGSNFKKLKRISMVAFAVAEILKEQKLIDSCHKVKVVAKWGNRLAKIGIPFKTVSFSNVTEVLDALDKLIKSPHCDVDILLEYFSDFKVEESQLNLKLMHFFEVCLNRHTETGLTPAMLRKAQAVIQCMKKDRAGVQKMLQKQLQQTSAYNYEALKFLLEQIGEDNPETQRGSRLLEYIGLYRRCSPPTSVELRHCFTGTGGKDGSTGELSSELDLLPEISAVRLPYHHLMGKDRWAIITPELNLHTLNMWLDMAHVLNMPRDNFILKTASNLIDAYTKASATSGSTSPYNAHVSPEFHTLLTEVNKVLSQLEERESAMYCCHALLDKLTTVGEKTIALQGCVMYANKWLHSAEEPQQKARAQKAVHMFSKKLQLFSAHWALCKSGLHSMGELRKLLKQPEELIQQLYLLPHVVDSHIAVEKDINQLCDEIADQHKTNLSEIRTSLLDKWILGASAAMDADQTMTFDVLSDDDGNEKDDLKRALYVMKSRDREKLLEHVASIANLNDGTVSPLTHKRALFCLLKTGTEEEITKLLNRTLE